MRKKTKIIVIANCIRSLYNVGSIFRTADAIGAEKLYLVRYTATPKREPLKIAKTALGSEKIVPWEHVTQLKLLLKNLRTENYEIIGLEYQKGKSISFETWKPKDKVVIILGNEKNGLSKTILDQCDKVIHLPMSGLKESLNVGVSFGAIGYYILAKRG